MGGAFSLSSLSETLRAHAIMRAFAFATAVLCLALVVVADNVDGELAKRMGKLAQDPSQLLDITGEEMSEETKEALLKRLAIVFRNLDKDSDGKVTRDEVLTRLFRSHTNSSCLL